MLLEQNKSDYLLDLEYKYPIVEMFHSIQGEGFWSGENAFFIRLAGCDVFCPWCDQKETWTMKKYPLLTLANIKNNLINIDTKHIIITGGEPLLHDLFPLTKMLKNLGYKTHIETSGSHPFSGEFDWVTFSPKPYKLPKENIYNYVSELKVVINDEKDFIFAESEAEKLSHNIPKYLQPQWENSASQQLIFNYILHHPQWRLSLQTHKFIQVR
ncbi:MAG: 7-carboxy-7-deazaguanine synthase QueE [Cyanobacteria bacterium]|nr:7-carboxy-7-deazaguanine synthase QueE [Cyanobacteria bacterium CG_2015-16_32_12]NCO77911.1 7-carboxy-7-deazaguanine synthase QueE [Cyanobacteria bacterium CG_2015-22_32_23]NCQ04464.1 7-carboxy-7-deazaguanine synthase QueE [Cyanobacteria bacterium CG_2015-09_32_10]NCQ43065.1 7-carboxy-7-deazaguanine synthase QueE [Cyanobacteria bacterium CG_2015-04_32_10]NCS85578.1 7-carboxy-7-deazaguanine synthase QueE [Cyanobacteria bacterium CG_2015-02_32_10]